MLSCHCGIPAALLPADPAAELISLFCQSYILFVFLGKLNDMRRLEASSLSPPDEKRPRKPTPKRAGSYIHVHHPTPSTSLPLSPLSPHLPFLLSPPPLPPLPSSLTLPLCPPLSPLFPPSTLQRFISDLDQESPDCNYFPTALLCPECE